MLKPLIGLVPLVDNARASYWMLPGYFTGLSAAGGLPLMLPLTDDAEALSQLTHSLDGLVLTGGQDVNPALYGEARAPYCGDLCPGRDAMEKRLLELFLAADKPVFAICRGLQLLNVALGGTLYQDLCIEHPSAICHAQKPPYDRLTHVVAPVAGTPLAKLFPGTTLAVNSYHHQAIKDLAPDLEAMAYAADGLVEAVRLPGAAFVWAVQWHPECAWQSDKNSLRLFERFLAACSF